jgi:hypothetical protein
MSAIKLSTPSSGSISLSPADTASNLTITVPAVSATMATLTTPSFATTIGVGGATPAASGAGITFPATQSASSDANTLDDYEEGTWTPTIRASSTNPTVSYSVQAGVYIKIGRQVTVYGRIQTASISGGSGNAWIGGLPFSATGVSSGLSVGYISNVTYGSGYTQLGLYLNSSEPTNFSFSRSGTGISADNLPIANLGSASDVTFSATYFV